MIEFMSNGHRDRFIQAVTKLGYQPGSTPGDWAACLFILMADWAISDQATACIDYRQQQVNWTKIRRIDGGHGWRCMLQLANCLYNGDGKFDLSEMLGCVDDKLFNIAIRAIQVARHGTRYLKLIA